MRYTAHYLRDDGRKFTHQINGVGYIDYDPMDFNSRSALHRAYEHARRNRIALIRLRNHTSKQDVALDGGTYR